VWPILSRGLVSWGIGLNSKIQKAPRYLQTKEPYLLDTKKCKGLAFLRGGKTKRPYILAKKKRNKSLLTFSNKNDTKEPYILANKPYRKRPVISQKSPI